MMSLKRHLQVETRSAKFIVKETPLSRRYRGLDCSKDATALRN